MAQQRYLLLQKVNRPYQVIFEEGQSIRFKLKRDKFFKTAVILGFGDDDIRFHYYRIKLDEIAEIDVSRKNFTLFSFRSGPGKLMLSGLAYIAIDQFNQTVIRDQPFRISHQTLIVGGALASSGVALKMIQKKRWKFKKRKHLMKIVNVSPSN